LPLGVLLLALAGCSEAAAPATSPAPAPRAPAPSVQPAAQGPAVLVLGDSLSAAYGLSPSEGWVALTAQRIAKEAPGWRVVNASISGETTAGGAARIAGELARNKPEVVVLALGANDGLRGLPLEQTRANLEHMVRAAKGAGARVLLVGMRMPPNLGRAFTEGFEQNFRTVAKQEEVALLPFLLEPIAQERSAFQPDELHPTAAVQPRLRDHVWPALAPLLKQEGAAAAPAPRTRPAAAPPRP
jgi:acyl-CoA thioesterase-1